MIVTRLLPVAAIVVAVLAFAAWQVTHRAAATDELVGNDGHGGSFTIIGMSDPDWETKLEQLFTEAGHPDVAGAMEKARAEREHLADGPGE
jgi:hypothetical protein